MHVSPECYEFSRCFCKIIDNERNGLETQVEAIMLLMLHP